MPEIPFTQAEVNGLRAQRYVRELADLAYEALDVPTTGAEDQADDVRDRLNEVCVLLTNIALLPEDGAGHEPRS